MLGVYISLRRGLDSFPVGYYASCCGSVQVLTAGCCYTNSLYCRANRSSDMKTLAKTISDKHNVQIHYMEVDKDHLHMMIETTPNINLSDYVRTLKSYTTFHIWKKYTSYLSKCFWKEHSGQMVTS